MHVIAQRLSAEVSLELVQGDAGWQFSRWARCVDDAELPKPPAALCERTFRSPEAALAFFQSALLMSAPPAFRALIRLGHERALLKDQLVKGDDGPDARWQAAKRTVN
ncbi:MAG: hypothetical protein ABI629_15590 [bacterium]